MSFDSTVNEFEMDASSQQFVQELRGEAGDPEPDLAVDGLSDSVLSRILGLFGVGRS